MYKIDTHVHTAEVSPCGVVKAKEIVKLYKESGYYGLIITDHYGDYFFHNHEKLDWNDKIDKLLTGYYKARDEAEKEGLLVLLGIEINFLWSSNDYLIYGLNEEFLKENRNLHHLDLKEFKELIKQEKAVIYQAHPFRPGMEILDPEFLDGVEVFNGNPRHNSRNDLAYKYSLENDLKMLSGSDFHQEEDLARGGIITDKKINNMEEFIGILAADDYQLLTSD